MSDAPLKGWNHTPDVPLQVSPFFQWPLRPKAMLTLGWIAEIYIRNLILMVSVAGGLHLYFHTFTK